MDKIIIDGGKPLRGVVPIGGAKNATLPILVATLVAPGEHRLARVPDLADVGSMLSLLGRVGCPSLGHAGLVSVDTTRVIYNEAPYDLVRKMRASVLAWARSSPAAARPTSLCPAAAPSACAPSTSTSRAWRRSAASLSSPAATFTAR
jgi:UDP-N-acetylglucosamine enolpyruvyl transferase